MVVEELFSEHSHMLNKKNIEDYLLMSRKEEKGYKHRLEDTPQWEMKGFFRRMIAIHNQEFNGQ